MTNTNKYIREFIYMLPAALLCACSQNIPADASATNESAKIYPDYADVTVPVNIAPLNFSIDTPADDYLTHIHTRKADGITIEGPTLDIDIDQWHELLKQAKGDSLFFDIYTRAEGKWRKHPAVKMAVAEEIDPYITYRQIEPSYVNFETMRINQRCLENFDEDEIFNNCHYADGASGQCINCHAAQNYNRDGNWQMHVRVANGGTVIVQGDNVQKIDLKLPETISAGVYPAWHPTLPLIVYSNNNTFQAFHKSDRNKIDVQDSASDLILYDIKGNRISFVANDSTEWETFPAWTPDGRTLYYASATVPAMPKDSLAADRKANFKDIRYNLYKRAFDPDKRTFSAPDTVYSAQARGKSALFPRVSPDGRYLLFTQADYGTFPIWHHESDLYLMDIAKGEVRALDEVNSDDTESYHSWSSNGRWILFSSRRDDGSYTRLYMAYFDADGNAHKPFMLPQRDPASNVRLFKSYNVPEFLAKPVTTSRDKLIDAIGAPPAKAQMQQ